MKVTRHDGKTENKILTAMVVDDAVATRIAARWREGGMFRSTWANLVGGWCVDYARTYGKAPGAHIEDVFEGWAHKATDDDLVDNVDNFLGALSGAYEEEAEGLNANYIIDQAGEHFNGVLLEAASEEALASIRKGEHDKAAHTIERWNRVELGVGAGVDVIGDLTATERAFEEKAEPLITYPGDLGAFIGDQLGRDEFVAITGATGRGKTWWLMDIAWRGMEQNRKVAFFEVGDMSEAQMLRRMACRAAAHPLKAPFELEIPTGIEFEHGEDMADVEYKTKEFDGPLTAGKAKKAMDKVKRRRAPDSLRLSSHPASSISVAGIDSVLDSWERLGWVADVVVIDYADILAAPSGMTPGDRECINESWKQMRNMSQRRHCLVVTATQADAGAYDADVIRRGNFSDDRRKNDHVTGMLGLNASDDEKDAGITRLNWTKRREEAFNESRCVHVAGCLAIGRPWLKSTF